MSGFDDRYLILIRRAGVGMVIAGIVLGAIAALWGVVADGFDDDWGVRVIASPMISFVAGAIVIVTAAALRRRRFVALQWATLVLALLTTVYWLVWLWGFDPDSGDGTHLQALGSLSTIVLCLTIVGQLLAAETKSIAARMYCRFLAIWMLCYIGWIVAFTWSGWMQRRGDLIGPPTVMAGLVTVGMLLVARVMLAPRRKASPKESLARRPRLRMNCPICAGEQTHTAGLVRCPHCRFVMMIEIQEPRCECGYLLYQLTGDMCPECGRPVSRQLDTTPPSEVPARPHVQA